MVTMWPLLLFVIFKIPFIFHLSYNAFAPHNSAVYCVYWACHIRLRCDIEQIASKDQSQTHWFFLLLQSLTTFFTLFLLEISVRHCEKIPQQQPCFWFFPCFLFFFYFKCVAIAKSTDNKIHPI